MGTPLQVISIKLNIIVIAICALLFCYVVVAKIQNRISYNLNKIIPYLTIVALVPIAASMTAYVIFNQDILEGLISNATFYNFFIIIYIYIYIKKKEYGLKEMNSVVLLLAWFSLFICYYLKLFFPNLEFSVPSYDGLTTYTYNLTTLGSPFFVWAGFIYLAKYKNELRKINLAFFLAFVTYPIIMQNGRAYMIFLAVTLFVFYKNELTLKGKVNFWVNVFFLLCAFFISASFIPSINLFLSKKMELFQDAFQASSGKEVEDYSANARVFETSLALSYIDKYYLFGVGFLKPSTQGKFISEYFYASDIGLIGIVFNYGVVGLLILSYHLKYVYTSFKDQILRTNSFLLGTLYFLIMRSVSSITTGEYVFSISITFLLIGIIYFGGKKLQEN